MKNTAIHREDIGVVEGSGENYFVHNTPAPNLERFYKSLSRKRRKEMPFDLKNFDTRKPDYEDQFYFFRLLFLDKSVKKTKKESILIGFCALQSLMYRNHHPWILPEYIDAIQDGLRPLIRGYSHEYLYEIVKDEISKIDFMKLIKIFRILNILKIKGSQ